MRRRGRDLARRAVALVLLAVYLVAGLGVLPSPVAIRRWTGWALGERFPCESCGCGCVSARQCWTACCCHTKHQRLMWAIRAGVAPPTEVDASDEEWIAAANAVRAGSAHCGLCVLAIKDRLRRGVGVGGDDDAGGAGAGCCDTALATSTPTSTRTSCGDSGCCSNDEPTPRPAGPAMSALSCRGIHELLTMTLPPAPLGAGVGVEFAPEREVSTATPDDRRAESLTLDVPAPPPRRGAVLLASA